MVVPVENLNKIASELERQEVANGGVLSNSEYAKLLAIYLYQNDLISAKFLWKRIPLTTKSTLTELEFIWKVGKAMRKKDYPEIYAALQFSWSSDIMPIMRIVEEEIRKSVLKLIGKSYSSLEIGKLSKYIGCDVPNTLMIIEKQGWRNDGSFIFPSPITEDTLEIRSDYNAFEKLTDSISFLEN